MDLPTQRDLDGAVRSRMIGLERAKVGQIVVDPLDAEDRE